MCLSLNRSVFLYFSTRHNLTMTLAIARRHRVLLSVTLLPQ